MTLSSLAFFSCDTFVNYIHNSVHESTLTIVPDIDECGEDIDGCEDYCSNTNGSYVCSCDDGYSLGDDDHSCDGMYDFVEITISYYVTFINFHCLK